MVIVIMLLVYVLYINVLVLKLEKRNKDYLSFPIKRILWGNKL